MKIEYQEDSLSKLPYDCVEVLAKAAMLGKRVEPISDRRLNGDLLGKVLEEYSVPAYLTEIYYSFVPLLAHPLLPVRDADQMTRLSFQSIEDGKRRCPNLDVERAKINQVKILQSVVANRIKIDYIKDFCNVYALYKGHVIEYEFMQPDILDFRRRIEGRIGIVVGKFHAERISDMLDGNSIPKPPFWSSYKEKMGSVSPEFSTLVNEIDNIDLIR